MAGTAGMSDKASRKVWLKREADIRNLSGRDGQKEVDLLRDEWKKFRAEIADALKKLDQAE
jgi:hypothetical protein